MTDNARTICSAIMTSEISPSLPRNAIIITEEKDENNTSSSVSFSTIDIYEHGVIIGDNPGGTCGGPPLAVDWHAIAHFSLSIDDYEANRVAPKRSLEELLLPEDTRVQMLKEWGYTADDIRKLCRPVYIDRARRQATRLQYSNGQRVFDVTVWDVVMNLFTMGCHGKKKREIANNGLDDSVRSQGSVARLCQAQDLVLKHPKRNKTIKVPQLHVDKSNGSAGTLETSMGSRSSSQ